MRISLFAALGFFLLTATIASAEVSVRIENGRKVFFNIPSAVQETRTAKGRTISPALRYSRNASQFSPVIDEVCAKYKVDPDLVKAVIQVESAYQINALSPAGAIGLMQLMPATAERFGVKQIYNPNENIDGGVKYLRFLLDLFENDLPLVVAAYNAGEGAVKRFQGIPRYKETQNYVQKVMTLYGKGDYVSTRKFKPQPPKTIYRYTDSAGVIHFTTQRPTAGAVQEINLTF